MNDFRGKAVLITGGTKGIGLAIGLAFGRVGAHVYLTHKWGSADEDAIRSQFAEIGALPPTIIEADVSREEETAPLLAAIHEQHDAIEAFISNVCVVQTARGLENHMRRSLLKSIEYSAWPFVSYLQGIEREFGRCPRYVVGVSSDGADRYFSHYEFVAVSKAVMETLCRYLATHLAGQDVRLNIVRSRNVLTDAVTEIFGDDYENFLRRHAGEEYFMHADEIGDAVLGLCSGLFDSMSGQILQIDKGMAFADTLMRAYDRRNELGLDPSNLIEPTPQLKKDEHHDENTRRSNECGSGEHDRHPGDRSQLGRSGEVDGRSRREQPRHCGGGVVQHARTEGEGPPQRTVEADQHRRLGRSSARSQCRQESIGLIPNDYHGRAVLVTGGTQGLGLAIGLAFGEQGADVWLTHRWGSADEDAVRRAFLERGASVPHIIEADAARDDDTSSVMAQIRERHDRLEVLVSNVAMARTVDGLQDYDRRSLLKSLEYSAWPLVGLTQAAQEAFGCYPRYTLGTSCDGPDTYYPGYDFVAASKKVMETFCRYMAKEVYESEGACMNVLRSRPVSTDSLVATFGPEFEPYLREHFGDDYFIDAEEVGRAALGLCSGLLDAMTGQVILLDRGVAFQDNLMRRFDLAQRSSASAAALTNGNRP